MINQQQRKEQINQLFDELNRLQQIVNNDIKFPKIRRIALENETKRVQFMQQNNLQEENKKLDAMVQLRNNYDFALKTNQELNELTLQFNQIQSINYKLI